MWQLQKHHQDVKSTCLSGNPLTLKSLQTWGAMGVG